jgi:integrase
MNARPREKTYTISDGLGLSLLVKPDGAKLWEFRYTMHGKAAKLAIKGGFPNISVAEARRRAEELNAKICSGIDPRVERKKTQELTLQTEREQQALQRKRSFTFEVIAREWLDLQSAKLAPKTIKAMTQRLELHVFPDVGAKPIYEIESDDILEIIRKLEQKGIGDNKFRIKRYCDEIFLQAKSKHLILANPIADLNRQMRSVKRGHHAAITETKDLAPLLLKLEEYPEGAVKSALCMMPLVFTRSSELCNARWTEFDLERATWKIPAKRMKQTRQEARDHTVPLSRQVLALLEKNRIDSPKSEYVFSSPQKVNSPITTRAVWGALRSLGYAKETVTIHGFRATARTILAERLGAPVEAIELQLAHAHSGSLGDTYNRTQFLDERKMIMQKWADYLDEIKSEARKSRVQTPQ